MTIKRAGGGLQLDHGRMLLEGGAEFAGAMAEADRAAIRMAGGPAAPIAIIAAAAVPANDDAQAGANGVRWFRGLGHRAVRALSLVDRASAEDPDIAAEIEASRLIYMLGGSPRYLAETLAGSLASQAMRAAYRSGAVIGGSSAGAMVLCEHYYDQASGQAMPGLNLLPGCCVMPHHDTFGRNWSPRLKQLLPDTLMLGIDEETGLLNDGPAGEWTVYGKGTVTVHNRSGRTVFHPEQRFSLPVEVKK